MQVNSEARHAPTEKGIETGTLIMLLKILFWTFVVIDVVVLVGFVFLAMVFAWKAESNPLGSLYLGIVLLLILTPILGGAIWLFLRAKSIVGRIIALVIVAFPVVMPAMSELIVHFVLHEEQLEHRDVNGRLVK